MRSSAHLTLCLFFSLLSAARAGADTEAVPNPGLFGSSFLEGWDRNLGVGLSGSDGNTHELKIVADGKGEYRDEAHRRKLVARFFLSKPDVGRTDREANVEYEENWKPFGNEFFIVGVGRYDYDRIEAWYHRINASLGFGAEIISTDVLTLRASIGGGVSHSWDGLTQTSPEGVVRLNLDYAVIEDVTFTTTHTYYPKIDNTPEYRLISDAELKADIGKAGGLTTSLGVNNEVDSLAELKKNDLTYYLRFGYDF